VLCNILLQITYIEYTSITVAARSKALSIFARSNTGIKISNPTQSMSVCVCAYSVFVLSCV
jgi:hypothetical protein